MSFKYILKFISAFLSKFKTIIFSGVLIGLVVFFLLYLILPKLAQGNKKVIGITGRFRPNELPLEIQTLIGRGLTRPSDSGPEPDLAWTWETSDKGKTWVFKLKDDIFWQDGTKVKSSDITYDFSDVSIERPDELTLVFTLEKGPYSPFPSVLSKPVFKKGLLGTGEWKVKKLSIVNTYTQELILVNGKDTLYYKFYPTIDRTKLAYKLGHINQISDIIDPTPFDTWNNSLIEESFDKSQVVTLFINTQDKLLSEKSVRQALYYAINKDALGVRANSPIDPDSWAYNPQVKSYQYDTVRAKEIIDQLPEEMKIMLEINLVSTPTLLPVAERISKDWEVVGIKTPILVSSIIPSEFQTFLTIFDIPEDPDQYPIWHSTQTDTNISKYKDDRIDKLLEEGRIQLDFEERRKIYLDFQRFLIEDAPAIFLYHPTYFNIYRK